MSTETDREHILIRGVNWIGDAVMTMPAVKALRKSRPRAHIALLVKPWVSPLFEKDPHIDEIILYRAEHAGIAGKLRLAAELRRRNFSAAVLLQNALDAAVTAFLAGIPERIGYERDGRGLLLTTGVPHEGDTKRLHHIDYYLNLLRQSGIEAPYGDPWLYLAPEERLVARDRLASLRRPVVGINPGATYGSSKRWRPERFSRLADRIMNEMNGSIVIFGGPAEQPIAEEITRKIGSDSGNDRFLNLAGSTSIRELAALISECDMLVTNDSGPMHIGYAVGAPLVAIFGSTSPEQTGPVGKGSTVIRAPGIECAPCFERECPKKNLACMDAVGVDEVFAAVKNGIPRRKAVFFDRDGTLCKDPGYLSRKEDFSPLPGLESLRLLKQAGFLLVGITNQSGVARGLVDESFVREINDHFVREHGFDRFYYCPHHPDDHCSCRKPEPGLLCRARTDLGIDLKRSFFVGDKDIDMKTARTVGARGIFVRTGQESASPSGELVADDIPAAVDLIIESEKAQ